MLSLRLDFFLEWSQPLEVPGYKADADKLKALGVQEVIIYCVNDGAVMSAWGDDQGVGGSEFITMMGDTFGPRLSLESWGSSCV